MGRAAIRTHQANFKRLTAHMAVAPPTEAGLMEVKGPHVALKALYSRIRATQK